MKPAATIPVESLNTEPYTSVLCYPRANTLDVKERIAQLRSLGVDALEFRGKTSAFEIPVLGKGYVGIVVVAHVGGERFAIKMRRVDADRTDLGHEADMLREANAVDVGPKFFAASKDFLLSQLVDGDLLYQWLQTHRDREAIRTVLTDVLEQCWRLDETGLDHGELSKAPKHILIDKSGKPFIVDFETSSTERKTANVTAVSQFLFQGQSDAAKIFTEVFGVKDKEQLVEVLRKYKKNRNRQNFEDIFRVAFS
jgi:putative serine/threonine protein kinase